MNKLFSLFIKYSLVPEQEFLRKASQAIYSLGEFAENFQGKQLRVYSQPQSLNITRHNHNISLTAEPELRQLFYTSSISGLQRYSVVGNRWLNSQEEDLEEHLKK